MTERKNLYSKYRPFKLSEIIGQDHVTGLLKNAVKQNKLSHAYLITGTRGTGKTSLARIIAKIVNCEQAPNTEYTKEDKFIKKIEEGSFSDIKELDAASNSSVEDTRAIRSEAYENPMMGNKKVFIIDEVHCLKEAAISVLLKCIEEPPKNSMFILCTTDPQKVKATIHSRCQVLALREVSGKTLCSHFKTICDKESIESIEDGCMELISSSSRGSVRDGLSLLDAIIAKCGKHIGIKDVEDVVGYSSHKSLLKLFKSISDLNEKNALLSVIKLVKKESKDPKSLINSMLDIWHDLLIQKCLSIDGVSDFFDEESKEEWNLIKEKLSVKDINDCLKLNSKFISDFELIPKFEYIVNSLVISLIQEIRKNKK